MMLFPSGDAFLTAIQEGGKASATVTASDDMCVVVDSIRARLAPLGIVPRIFAVQPPNDVVGITLRIEARNA